MALGMKKKLAVLDVEKKEIPVVLTSEGGSETSTLPAQREGRWARV